MSVRTFETILLRSQNGSGSDSGSGRTELRFRFRFRQNVTAYGSNSATLLRRSNFAIDFLLLQLGQQNKRKPNSKYISKTRHEYIKKLIEYSTRPKKVTPKKKICSLMCHVNINCGQAPRNCPQITQQLSYLSFRWVWLRFKFSIYICQSVENSNWIFIFCALFLKIFESLPIDYPLLLLVSDIRFIIIWESFLHYLRISLIFIWVIIAVSVFSFKYCIF